MTGTWCFIETRLYANSANSGVSRWPPSRTLTLSPSPPCSISIFDVTKTRIHRSVEANRSAVVAVRSSSSRSRPVRSYRSVPLVRRSNATLSSGTFARDTLVISPRDGRSLAVARPPYPSPCARPCVARAVPHPMAIITFGGDDDDNWAVLFIRLRPRTRHCSAVVRLPETKTRRAVDRTLICRTRTKTTKNWTSKCSAINTLDNRSPVLVCNSDGRKFYSFSHLIPNTIGVF